MTSIFMIVSSELKYRYIYFYNLSPIAVTINMGIDGFNCLFSTTKVNSFYSQLYVIIFIGIKTNSIIPIY